MPNASSVSWRRSLLGSAWSIKALVSSGGIRLSSVITTTSAEHCNDHAAVRPRIAQRAPQQRLADSRLVCLFVVAYERPPTPVVHSISPLIRTILFSRMILSRATSRQ